MFKVEGVGSMVYRRFKGFGVYGPSGIFEKAGFRAAFYDFGIEGCLGCWGCLLR